MENMHTDHGVNQVSELAREWNGSFSLPSVIGHENSQQSLNRSDVTRNFPNFRRSNCIYFIFLVAACEILFRSDKELWLVWILFCDIQNNFHVISVSKMAGWKCIVTKLSRFCSLLETIEACFKRLTLFSPISSVMKTSAMTYIIDRPPPIITTGA